MSSGTELIGCPACKGKKTLVGLGSVPEQCRECKGIGWIERPVLSEEDKLSEDSAHHVKKVMGAPVKGEPYDLIEPKQQSIAEVEKENSSKHQIFIFDEEPSARVTPIISKKKGRPKKNAEI